MEDALAPRARGQVHPRTKKVLILVLMEDALAPEMVGENGKFKRVLILVLMEDALAPFKHARG